MSIPGTVTRPPKKWGILASVVFGLFMVILDSTVVNVALATLRREFSVSLSDTQWIVSVYTMALGIATPLSGYLADRFGSKRIYLLGLGLFLAGSALCGISPSLTLLIAARALQGIGGGLALPLGTAILFATFRPEEQGSALGIFGISLVLAPALGPILGGWLVDHDLWRWIFFINVPIGLLGLTLGSYFLVQQPGGQSKRFDLPGFVASAIGFGAVLYAASRVSEDGWGGRNVVVGFVIGGIALTIFALIELVGVREPLLNLRLFQNRIFLNANGVGYVSVIALFGAEFLLPLYLQTLRGKTAFETGLLLLPLAVTSGIATPLAGRLYDRIGARPLLALGFIILMVNTWQLSLLTASTDLLWIMVLLAIRGLALGLTVQTTLVAALSVVPTAEVARASALSNSTRQVVQSLGIAFLATILTVSLSQDVKDFQSQFQSRTQQTSSHPFALCLPFSSGNGAGVPVPPPVEATRQKACDESVRGFQQAYQATFVAALVAFLLSLFLPGWPGRVTRRSEGASLSAAAPQLEHT